MANLLRASRHPGLVAPRLRSPETGAKRDPAKSGQHVRDETVEPVTTNLIRCFIGNQGQGEGKELENTDHDQRSKAGSGLSFAGPTPQCQQDQSCAHNRNKEGRSKPTPNKEVQTSRNEETKHGESIANAGHGCDISYQARVLKNQP